VIQPYLWGHSFFLGISLSSSGITVASRLSVVFYDVNVSDSRASTRSVSGSNATFIMIGSCC
jgi:hypothetical protein